MTETPTARLRQEIAEQIRMMRHELPRLEQAYAALGGNLDSLPPLNGQAAVHGTATAKAQGEVLNIPKLVRDHLADAGKRRTQSLLDWLHNEHAIDIKPGELFKTLTTSGLVQRGDRGWWTPTS